MKPALRSVRNDEPTPSQAWLASWRREQDALTIAANERAARRSLKPLVMGQMSKWGMSDCGMAAELERSTGVGGSNASPVGGR